MMRILLPILLLAAGVGAGAGAGLILAPTSPADAADYGEAASALTVATDHGAEAPVVDDVPAAGHDEAGGSVSDFDYVRFNNQFVIPVVEGAEVVSLVLLSLSVEVPAGQEDAVLLIEPKLRDVFLQVLFDHANTGGFEGMFTATSAMRALRASLLAAAHDEIGALVSDVLIVELVRQDT